MDSVEICEVLFEEGKYDLAKQERSTVSMAHCGSQKEVGLANGVAVVSVSNWKLPVAPTDSTERCKYDFIMADRRSNHPNIQIK